MLGQLVRGKNFRVELCSAVVETSVDERDLGALWSHELRWAITMHAARPTGYSFSFLTYALPLACIYALASGMSMLGGTIVLAAALLRLGLHYTARWALATRSPDRPWLVPVRDVFGFAVWVAHFFVHDVRWRDTVYHVGASGRLSEVRRT